MRILVTGSSGFIGSHLAETCQRAGHRVIRVDVADERGPIDCRDFFRQSAARHDLVIHAAAVVGGRRKVAWTPLEHAANLEIDAALFQWAERTRPGRVVYFSSSCAYPIHLAGAKRRLRESDINLRHPAWPDELYGWTKLTGELVAATAAAAGVPVTIVRPFSVYGDPARMKEGFAVRSFVEQAAAKADPIVIWGDAGQVRDFIHVDDVCAAILALAKHGVDGPVNLGTGAGTSLMKLAMMMARIADYGPQIKVDEGMPAGVMRLVAEPSRLREFYEPRVALEDYLAKVLG